MVDFVPLKLYNNVYAQNASVPRAKKHIQKDVPNVGEIDLSRILKIIKKHWIACAIVAVASAVVAFLVTSFVIEPRYTSSRALYVNSGTNSSAGVNLNEINASQKLANTYIVILKNGTIYDDLSIELDGKYTSQQLKSMIALSTVDNTEVIRITATSTDPYEAADICQKFSELAPAALEQVVLGGQVEAFGEPDVNTTPSSPNKPMAVAVAAVGGAFIAACLFVIISFLDTKVRDANSITERYDFSLIGMVPDQDAAYDQVGGFIRKSSSKGAPNVSVSASAKINPIISDKTPFSVLEAYNKICANVRFMISNEKSRVVIVTSSIPGEFKSTTSSNLAISLAQGGARVLLIDADLRKPTLHNCIRTPNECGFSNILAGFCDVDDAIFEEIKPNLDFIPAGLLPPNPVTLLGSEHAKKLVTQLGQEYDYVVIDSPPLNLVSDATLMSQYATGVLMVIRQGKTTYPSVDLAVNSLKLANANLIGGILTGSDISESPYSSYGYGYGYGYGYNYEKGGADES